GIPIIFLSDFQVWTLDEGIDLGIDAGGFNGVLNYFPGITIIVLQGQSGGVKLVQLRQSFCQLGSVDILPGIHGHQPASLLEATLYQFVQALEEQGAEEVLALVDDQYIMALLELCFGQLQKGLGNIL